MRRSMVVLTIVAVLVAMAATAGSAMAQNDDKAAKRAAKQANKQASRAAKQANKQAQNIQNPGPANAGTQKALPSSGGISAGNIALLGAGALMVGGGLLVHRVARQ